MLILPLALQAQADTGNVSIADLEAVESYTVNADGSINAVLANGETVLIPASNVTVAADGTVFVTANTAAELETLVASAGPAGDLPPGAAAGVGALGLAAAAGGGGGGSSAVVVPALSKTITVIDGPLENALVFYDTSLDGVPGETEFLGLTDAQGALDVTYTPVANAKFIIVPAPVADAAADYGWSDAFAAQFDSLVTTDVITNNAFEQLLTATDAGSNSDQVVSPISTLIDSGAVSEQQIRDVFGIDNSVDLASFNFAAELDSTDPAALATAKALSTAATVLNNVVEAAVAAASTSGTLTSAQTQSIAAKAVADAAKALAALPPNTSIEDVTSAATAVAVSGALNPAIDTDALVGEISNAISSGNTVQGASDAAVANLQTSGQLTSEQTAGVNSIKTALETSSGQIQNAFQNLPEGGVSSPEFQETLDNIEDESLSQVDSAINTEILGINLVRDTQTAVEGQTEIIKGNLLSNDLFSDGTALPGTTSISTVNRRAVADENFEVGGAGFTISTSDWNTFSGRTVSIRNIAEELGMDFADFPRADIVARQATSGSAAYTTVTVAAGEKLVFDYSFGSYDYVPYNDYSFVAIQATDGGTAAEQAGVVLRGEDFGGPADVSDIKGDRFYTLAGRFTSTSDTFEYTFAEAGTYTIAIGATDVGDRIVDSVLTTSNIRIEGNVDQETRAVTDMETIGNVRTEAVTLTEVQATLFTGFYGSLIVTKNGDYIYQVGGANADDIPLGQVVSDNFTYTVEVINPDGTSSFARQSLTIQVTGVAEPSTISVLVDNVNADSASEVAIVGLTTEAVGAAVALTVTGINGHPPLQIEGVVVAEDGSFSTLADLSDFPDGTLTVTASITTDAGTRTTTDTLVKDTTADADPGLVMTFLAPPDPADLTDTNLYFSISGLDPDADASIRFSDGSNNIFFGVSANGNFNIDGSSLEQGSITTRITIEDEAGNERIVSGPGAAIEPAPVLTLTNDTGTSAGDGLTNDPTVTVVAAAGRTIGIFSGDTQLGTATEGAPGEYTFTPAGLADGPVSLVAVVLDAGVVTEPPNALTFTLDTAIGTPTIAQNLSAADELIISGTADAGTTVNVSATSQGVTISASVIASAEGTWSFGTNGAGVIGDGAAFVDALVDDAAISVTATSVDAAGNSASATAAPVVDVLAPEDAPVTNVTQNTGYLTLSAAIADADPNDVLEMADGAFQESVTIDKPLTINGANSGIAGYAKDSDGNADPENLNPEGGTGARSAETVVQGTITVAASDVILNGLKIDGDLPLDFNESLLTDTPGALDGFQLLNSILVGYSEAPTFDANSPGTSGTYNGPAVADGWVIAGNLMGGVQEQGEGALYLSGLSNSAIEDNMFWRPSAGHLYVSSLTDTRIVDNFFYHGVHAGGIDMDGFEADYGLDQGYGYGASGGDATHFGRNFWVEMKGTNSVVNISGNDGQYNSGGVQLFGDEPGYQFNNISVTNNVFRDFINADPDTEGSVEPNDGLSGFMGAIAVSVQEGSTASSINLSNNTISAATDQIYNLEDVQALVQVAGIVSDLSVNGNTLEWTASSEALLAELASLNVAPTNYDAGFSAVLLVGGLNGAINVNSNAFDDGSNSFGMIGLYVLPDGTATFHGNMSASLTEAANDFSLWDNAGSRPVLLAELESTTNPELLDVEADVFLLVEGQVVELILGTDAADNLSGTAANEAFYGSVGNDAIDLTDGGIDGVILNVDPAVNGVDSITGFTLGLGADTDALSIGGLVTSDLRGEGNNLQLVNDGSTVGANSGLLIVQETLAAADAANPAFFNGTYTLQGLDAGDTFYIMSTDGTNSSLSFVELAADTADVASITQVAQFVGLSDLSTLNAASFENFIPTEV
ncbi:MAG: Ig-like domain-containing protein [Rhodobacteraceae bacterium]|nr:Ig-like domain-containing protein [Paracoccaceae bacterium]